MLRTSLVEQPRFLDCFKDENPINISPIREENAETFVNRSALDLEESGVTFGNNRYHPSISELFTRIFGLFDVGFLISSSSRFFSAARILPFALI